MITLKINNIEITVPRGDTVWQAAKKAGVFIPSLCHDERIKPFGACRVCLVADRRRPDNLIPSCFTPARAGMDIVTDSPEVVDAVKTQIQMILVNHPLDCPVCEKAGECALQDLVVRYDIRTSPFKAEPFARYIDRESPLIERNMTRCILCGRCVRICNELQGCGEIDFIHRGFKTVVGTDGGRVLNCDFCGLCVSACPVGAISDKLYKDKARCWNLEHRVAPCTQCGMGCLATYSLEKGQIRRMTPVQTDEEKGLLCVRGQFGWRAGESPSRLWSPKVRRNGALQDVQWSEALDEAASRLNGILRTYGPSAVAMLTADHLTTEESRTAKKLFSDTLNCAHIGSLQAGGYRRICVDLLQEGWTLENPGALKAIGDTDILLVIGSGAAELHPVLKPVIHDFLKQEGKELIVLSGWPDILSRWATFSFPIDLEYAEDHFVEFRRAARSGAPEDSACLRRCDIDTEAMARLLSLTNTKKKMTILLTPNLFGDHAVPARLATMLRTQTTRIIPLGAQANSAGAIFYAGLVSSGAAVHGDTLISAIETGAIRALYLVNEDPLETLPDPARVRAALQKLDLIICQNTFTTSVADMAHVILPSALLSEKSGSICSIWNEERQIRAMVAPPAEVRSDMDIFSAMATLIEPAVTAGALSDPYWQESQGQLPPCCEAISDALPFRLIAVPSIFGDSALARQSPDLSQVRRGLSVVLNSQDFENLELAEREIVRIQTPFGSTRAEAERDAVIPSGMILLRHAAGCAEGLSLLRFRQVATPAAITRIAL